MNHEETLERVCAECDAAIAEAAALRRDMREETEGRLRLRERLGAAEAEGFAGFVERLARERDAARAERDRANAAHVAACADADARCAERDAARAECDRLSRDLHATLVAHRAAEREADNWYELAMALGAERARLRGVARDAALAKASAEREAAQDMMAAANAALRARLRAERDAARAELAWEVKLRDAARTEAADARGEALRERERAERMQEHVEQQRVLLGEWLTAWERTADGDRVRATEAALREEG